MYRSYGDLFFADGFIFNAKTISDSPEFSFRTIVSLFARSRSFILRISLSTFPLLLWSLMGHSTCLMYLFSQTSSKRLLLKMVAGAVRIVCGIPCYAIYYFEKAITLSVSGFRKNFSSGHPLVVNGYCQILIGFICVLK